MATPVEEPGSTGVAVVNSSDFLLLCLCIAAAVSLWKLLLHRRRIHNHDEVKRKGSCPISTLRRSQSPPQPRELSAPPAPKSRSTIVFDEWDGPNRILRSLRLAPDDSSRHIDLEESSVLFDISDPRCLQLYELAFTQAYFLTTAAFAAAILPQMPLRQAQLPIIIIGGGGGCMSRFFSNHLHHPTAAVELCPGVIKACRTLFNGYGIGCSVICCDGCSYINQVALKDAACVIIDTHIADETLGTAHRLQSPCPSMRSASFLLACYRRAVGSVIVNLALKGYDSVGLDNVNVSRCGCTASCYCEQPVARLHRGRLLLHVPRGAHVILVNAGSPRTGKNGNIVLIISHLPVDGLIDGANSVVQHHGLTLYDSSVAFDQLPRLPGSDVERCQLR